jgi:hypothetical protein
MAGAGEHGAVVAADRARAHHCNRLAGHVGGAQAVPGHECPDLGDGRAALLAPQCFGLPGRQTARAGLPVPAGPPPRSPAAPAPCSPGLVDRPLPAGGPRRVESRWRPGSASGGFVGAAPGGRGVLATIRRSGQGRRRRGRFLGSAGGRLGCGALPGRGALLRGGSLLGCRLLGGRRLLRRQRLLPDAAFALALRAAFGSAAAAGGAAAAGALVSGGDASAPIRNASRSFTDASQPGMRPKPLHVAPDCGSRNLATPAPGRVDFAPTIFRPADLAAVFPAARFFRRRPNSIVEARCRQPSGRRGRSTS